MPGLAGYQAKHFRSYRTGSGVFNSTLMVVRNNYQLISTIPWQPTHSTHSGVVQIPFLALYHMAPCEVPDPESYTF